MENLVDHDVTKDELACTHQCKLVWHEDERASALAYNLVIDSETDDENWLINLAEPYVPSQTLKTS